MIGRIAKLSVLWAAIVSFVGVPAQAAMPKLTPQEAIALFAVAGFRLGPDKHPLNRCGEKANPRVTFIDMDDDGQPEAYFIDQGSCYKPDGQWYAIVTRASDGSWRRVLEGEGTLKATGTAFNGWFVLTATGGGNTVRLHYNGTAYAPAGSQAQGAVASAAPPAAAASGDAYPTDGWKLPVGFAQLSPQDQATLMHAAGMQLEGGTWKGCDGSSEVDLKQGGVEFRDLNGDGRPEAIVTDGGVACYGNTGQGFTVLLAVPGGWKVIQQVGGIPMYLKTHGPDGFTDIMVGGPGFCFGVWRWNGQKYAYSHSESDPGGPNAGKACKP
jgi:hypothetical protein